MNIPTSLTLLESTRLVWRFSLPLMISALSINVMQFVNRVILARYDLDALNIATLIWVSVGVFHYCMYAIASITEVFVGQAHGADEHRAIGPLVWQMIWVTVLLSLVGVPLFWMFEGIVMPALADDAAHQAYLWAPLPSCLQGLSSAIMGFFVGRGHVRIVTLIALAVNVVNALLTMLLVHGVEGWFEGQGLPGTMWSALVAQALQCAIFFGLFLKKTHADRFATRDYRFRLNLAKLEVFKAVPAALSHFFEIAAWAFLIREIAHCGEAHWTVTSLNHGIWFLFAFASDGLRQGMIAVCANALGARAHAVITRLLWGGMIVVALLIVAMAVPLVVAPSWVIQCFIPGGVHAYTDILALNMVWLWLFIVGDGFAWVLVGVLTAAGDTRWVMISNIISVTLFSIVPFYWLIHSGWLADNAWAVGLPSAFYGFANAVIMGWRYRFGSWRSINLMNDVSRANAQAH